MPVIQNIRDKYAKWAAGAIGLALVGFIVMDAFSGRTGLFGGNDNIIGEIDGDDIETKDFNAKVEAATQQAQAQSQGAPMSDQQKKQINDNVWNSEIASRVMAEQFEELGLTVGESEMKDVLYGPEAPQDLRQRFTDPNTNTFNVVEAQKFINSIRKSGTPQDIKNLDNYISENRNQRMMAKYMSLLTNTIYVPKWFVEKKTAENGVTANINYVAVPYTSVPDSSVKVSDDEIKAYINSHKDAYEQTEETRNIQYVTFSAAPSASDTSTARGVIENLKQSFADDNNPLLFLAKQGSVFPYDTTYHSGKAIQIPAKDSVLALQPGQIYGPYQDGGNFVMAKMIDIKTMPDSAKAQHILIQTYNPQTQQPMTPDSIAKVRIDSIKTAIQGGANFDSLAKRFSDDKGSAEKGGLLATGSSDYFAQGQMVKEFNDSVFMGRPGQLKVVKTVFGYHLIKILDVKDIVPQYKVAYLAKPIYASNQTVNDASSQAMMFAGNSQGLKKFEENYEKTLKVKGLNKNVANDIHAMDYSISGLPDGTRSLIQSIFKADEGEVLNPVQVGDMYVVAAVTNVNEAGLMSPANARMTIEPILLNEKKAAQITKNIGSYSTLQQVASKTGQPISTADSLSMGTNTKALGFEPKVIGAVFNPANKGKVIGTPIPGNQAVYVVEVTATGTRPVEAANLEMQQQGLEQQQKQAAMYANPVNVLKKEIKIKDNRARFY